MPINQQTFDLLFAPAAAERSAVQRGDRGCVARARLRYRRVRAREKAAEKADHRRGSCTASCGCASGATQVQRLRRRACIGRGGAESRDPVDVGCARAASTAFGGCSPAGHSAASLPAAVPVMRGAPVVDTRRASRSGAMRGATMVRPPGPNTCRYTCSWRASIATTTGERIVGGDEWRGESSQCRQADGRLAGGERDAARRGDADAQSGEAARSRWSPRCGQARRNRAVPGRITRAISGISASAWPRCIGSDSARHHPRARCRARRRSRLRARYRWQGRACADLSPSWPACRAPATSSQRRQNVDARHIGRA